MRLYLLLISLIVSASTVLADTIDDGAYERHRYTAYIETPKAYISGVCLLLAETDTITGSIVNEFGISALDFIYVRDKNKLKIVNIIKPLDKWYVKRVLSQDLKMLLTRSSLDEDSIEYYNLRRKILYRLKHLDDTPE